MLTNLLVSLSMLQGCVAAVNALTGVNPYGEWQYSIAFATFLLCWLC